VKTSCPCQHVVDGYLVRFRKDGMGWDGIGWEAYISEKSKLMT